MIFGVIVHLYSTFYRSGESSRSQEETTTLSNAVHMVNVYIAGGLWRMTLN